MKRSRRTLASKISSCIVVACGIAISPTRSCLAQQSAQCLDDICIGQSIEDSRFNSVPWILPKSDLVKEECNGIGCRPEIAFRGYPSGEQTRLAEALRLKYSSDYNLVTKENLSVLRLYHYDCNPSARGILGERRFMGAYLSAPSSYLTVVGMRLIDGHLTVYRIARQFPYHNQGELDSLATTLHAQYGEKILFYHYLSSNAYSDVIKQHRDGWFARSTMFNPTDLADNAAELVLIDPKTRELLQPSSVPESGEIKPLPAIFPQACGRSIPLQ